MSRSNILPFTGKPYILLGLDGKARGCNTQQQLTSKEFLRRVRGMISRQALFQIAENKHRQEYDKFVVKLEQEDFLNELNDVVLTAAQQGQYNAVLTTSYAKTHKAMLKRYISETTDLEVIWLHTDPRKVTLVWGSEEC